MLPISKILLPVDFSERSLAVLPYARAIAAHYRARLTLMHVVSPFFVVPPTGVSDEVFLPVSNSAVADKGRELDNWAPGQLEGIDVQRVIYEGEPEEEIVSFARSENVDLVACSTHGYGALRRFLIGSVAAKLLHDLPCPVLTGVHLEETARTGPVRIAKILCAVDLGAQTPTTLAYAAQFARDFAAELEIMHVIPALSPHFDLEGSEDWRSRVLDRIQSDLQIAAEVAGADSAQISIGEGDIAETVCSRAGAGGASLLIIGRGVYEAGGRRLRTDAYAIVRQAPCPVISV